jgi:hypothetical protein
VPTLPGWQGQETAHPRLRGEDHWKPYRLRGDRRTAQEVAGHPRGHLVIGGQVVDRIHLLLDALGGVDLPADDPFRAVMRPARRSAARIGRRVVHRLEPFLFDGEGGEDLVDGVGDVRPSMFPRPARGHPPVVPDRRTRRLTPRRAACPAYARPVCGRRENSAPPRRDGRPRPSTTHRTGDRQPSRRPAPPGSSPAPDASAASARTARGLAEHRRCLRRRHQRIPAPTAPPRPGLVVRGDDQAQPGHLVPVHAVTVRSENSRREPHR